MAMILLALIVLFIVVPIAEIWVIIQIGHWIGLLPTLGLMRSTRSSGAC